MNSKVAYILLMFVGIMLAHGGALFAERNAQLLYFKAPKNAPKAAHVYQAGADPVEVALERNNFSPNFKIQDGEIVLRFLGAPLGPEQEFPEGAPALSIPATYRKVLILAFPDPGNKVFPVRFKAINANNKSFGVGDRMFINFTENKIIGMVGKRKLNLKPLSIAVVKNAGSPKEEYEVRLDRIDPINKKPFPFIRQVWRQSASNRSLIFVYSPPGSSRVTYYNAPIKDL